MDDSELLRYSRHILLPEFGVEGQERLRASHALVVGAGGLGCPASLYLAAAGLGLITIADPDRVDLTNLQRQILYTVDRVGFAKVDAARGALSALNPTIRLDTIATRLEGEALDAAVAAADIVLDCSDNFATRHAVNRACVRHRRPLVSGAAIRFDGQLAAFDLRHADTPCYACLFPEGLETEEVRCAVMGVFAPLTGMIGAQQAGEAIGLLVGLRAGPQTTLLLVDAKEGTTRRIRIRRDPHCAVCASV